MKLASPLSFIIGMPFVALAPLCTGAVLTFDNSAGDGSIQNSGNWAPGYDALPTTGVHIGEVIDQSAQLEDRQVNDLEITFKGSSAFIANVNSAVRLDDVHFTFQDTSSWTNNNGSGTENLIIGRVSGANSSLTWNSSGSLTNVSQLDVGQTGTGTLTQSAGSISASTFNIHNGTYTSTGGGTLTAGKATVTGGTASIGGTLETTAASGAAMSISAGNSVAIKSGGELKNTQSGASMTIDGGLHLDLDGKLNHNGTINVNAGGTLSADSKLDIRGSTLIHNSGTISVVTTLDLASGTDASLYFSAEAIFAGNTLEVLQLRNGTSLGFEIDGAGNHSTITGNSLQVRMGSTPDLVVDFLVAPTIGQSFDLITGVEKFSNYQGVGSGYEFNTVTVNGLEAGQEYDLIYDTTLANQGFLRLEIIDSIPEPSSAAMLGLGAMGLLMRRRK
ncbi:PEP-CTERM sorting domain-containing protein [Verrucomicrobiaceae bacterium N1E253]|uniref:PEP-CTERM sorting domain-containing protein n=1 Tax=Oceaniferula marina TaxID=2748318 RepID=A0A851GBY9_9BACT|nr:PEP-CTERM sorting domain-containing protein [Oceaniferula marina]NWK55113.1 PEP-CTERM sorting domain-containing protein [Oceaniferula marina]